MREGRIDKRTATFSTGKEQRQMNLSRKPSFCRALMTMAVLASVALIASVMATPAMAEFGLNGFDFTFTNKDGSPATQAGSHPYEVTNSFAVNFSGDPFSEESFPDEEIKDLIIDMLPGFSGDPTSLSTCSLVDFARLNNDYPLGRPDCPNSSAIGLVSARVLTPQFFIPAAVYNLEGSPGVPARLGFYILGVPITVNVGVSEEPPYVVQPRLSNVVQTLENFGAVLTLWGTPSDHGHDAFRGSCLDFSIGFGEPSYASKGSCPVEPSEPFLTLPGSCTGPAVTSYEVDSWQTPGKWVGGSTVTHDNAEPPNPQGFTGCAKLPFSPQVASRPTTEEAESGTGLDFDVDFDQEGLTSRTGLAQSQAKKAVVTLPEGVTINPSIGEGLGVCTPADIEREALDSAPGAGCPNSSKVGTLHLETPLVDEAIDGPVFLAQQDDPSTAEPGAENPFDSLIALYLVLKNPNLGVNVKLPMKVEPDPRTGRLVSTLEDIPQLPFSHFNFHFREGQRAPLVTPSACGAYTTEAKFWPWSDPDNPRTVLSSFEITGGVGDGPCPPGGIPPFHPAFEAGSLNNNAGSFSPFNMRLIRGDGEQDMTKFSSILPPGVVGSLSGVGKCPDSAVEAAKAKTGRQEQGASSCPANSKIGHTLAGAGVGSALTYVPGKIYLAGPYKGAPLSVISITPAVAGPFDAGTVVVRLGLDLNPRTAEVEVDGAASDPIPHILKGIVLKVRDLRVYVDRPDFTLNPTSCDESKAKATLFGSFVDVFDPNDDVPVDLSTRYQAANCSNLGFKPKLNLDLTGGTKRGGHPGLAATYTPRKGDANLEGLVVRLPRSAFLEQSHIRTICTRVQFSQDNCPKAAQYGFIRAFTPLLDEPLAGPVYLRSSDHKLPDLVFDLHGLVDVEVATRIDSVRGGIRATLDEAPDAPLSRVLLNMQGGKKGLIVNSRELCTAKSRANVEFTGHNGKLSTARPLMRAQCGGARKGKR